MVTSIKFKTLEWKFRETSIKYPESANMPTKKITSPKDFYDLFIPVFNEEPNEIFLVAWLNSANRVIGFEKVTSGLLNSSLVDARSVFRSAIVANCASIIIAHNHPSGNPDPSNEDIAVTKKITEAGRLIDIPVFDHIIFAGDNYTSFVEKELI